LDSRELKRLDQRAIAAFESGAVAEAERLLRRILDLQPGEAQYKRLARLLWLEDRHNEFLQLCDFLVVDETFCFVAIELLRQARLHDRALNSLASLGQHHRKDIRFFLNAAWIYIQLNDGKRAHQCAAPAFEAQNTDATADAYVSSLLMIGDYDRAESVLTKLMANAGPGGRWMAYKLCVDRVKRPEKDPMYRALITTSQLDHKYPELFASGFNDSLRRAVDTIYKFKKHPLDQSLIDGQQTALNLVAAQSPALKRYLHIATGEVARYGQGVQNTELFQLPRDGKAPVIRECWSVTLDGGHHQPHFHPDGVISGTYYLTVPASATKGSIYFGIPPFATPATLEPLFEYQPEEGALILFPSYFWHGTTQSARGVKRQTLPFDAA